MLGLSHASRLSSKLESELATLFTPSPSRVGHPVILTNAEGYRVVSSGEAAAVEPIVEPAGDDAPRVVPPEMFDEILDGLINDDLLEVGLMKEMRGSGTQPSCWREHTAVVAAEYFATDTKAQCE